MFHCKCNLSSIFKWKSRNIPPRLQRLEVRKVDAATTRSLCRDVHAGRKFLLRKSVWVWSSSGGGEAATVILTWHFARRRKAFLLYLVCYMKISLASHKCSLPLHVNFRHVFLRAHDYHARSLALQSTNFTTFLTIFNYITIWKYIPQKMNLWRETILLQKPDLQ